VTDADGTNRIQVPLTVSSAPLTDLAWSPDGRFLYTISDLQIDRIDVNSLIEASRSSQEIIEFSGSSGSYQPSWSPDGTSLAFARGTFDNDSFSSTLLEKTDIFVYDPGSRTVPGVES
jgi:Tol biopolymer transport system component